MKGAQGRRSPLKLFERFRPNKAGLFVPHEHDKSEEKNKFLEKLFKQALSPGRTSFGGDVGNVRHRYQGDRKSTKRPMHMVRAENRRRNKAARIARRKNRV